MKGTYFMTNVKLSKQRKISNKGMHSNISDDKSAKHQDVMLFRWEFIAVITILGGLLSAFHS